VVRSVPIQIVKRLQEVRRVIVLDMVVEFGVSWKGVVGLRLEKCSFVGLTGEEAVLMGNRSIVPAFPSF
jgi:hypothetical protein